jgi:hypothetical protein
MRTPLSILFFMLRRWLTVTIENNASISKIRALGRCRLALSATMVVSSVLHRGCRFCVTFPKVAVIESSLPQSIVSKEFYRVWFRDDIEEHLSFRSTRMIARARARMHARSPRVSESYRSIVSKKSRIRWRLTCDILDMLLIVEDL